MIEIETVDILAEGGKQLSPKQAALFRWYRSQRARRLDGLEHEHILAAVWGRRCGKSDGCSWLFAEVLVDLLCEAADDVAAGRSRPWAGLGQPRTKQRKAKPNVLCFAVAPEGRDLVEITGFLLDAFAGNAEVYLHDDPRMQLIDGGSKMLFVHEGACLSLWFVPAKNAAAMVGRGPAAVLMTESGFIPSVHWDRLVPSFWDRKTWVIAEGTPTQDASHWFTRLVVSGLPDGHPEADRQISERDPRVATSRANTIDHAYLESARAAAKHELAYRGARWGDLWIYASWRLPADVVFDEFRPEKSVVTFQAWPSPRVIFADGTMRSLPLPDTVEIDLDWHRGAAPGAMTCCYVWHRSPLDKNDPRPLFLVVAEFMDDEVDGVKGKRLTYTDQEWWRVIRDARDNHGVRKIYGDPTGLDLIKGARRGGLKIYPADNEDKGGRIELLNAQCHAPEGGYPALLIARECVKTAKCLGTLQWRKDREGKPTNVPSGYNDHLADALCYLAGRWAKPASALPSSLM